MFLNVMKKVPTQRKCPLWRLVRERK